MSDLQNDWNAAFQPALALFHERLEEIRLGADLRSGEFKDIIAIALRHIYEKDGHFATQMGISHSTLSRWREIGVPPTPTTVKKAIGIIADDTKKRMNACQPGAQQVTAVLIPLPAARRA